MRFGNPAFKMEERRDGATLSKGGYDAVRSLLGAGGADYLWLKYNRTDRNFSDFIYGAPTVPGSDRVLLSVGSEKDTGKLPYADMMSAAVNVRNTGAATLIGSAPAASYNAATGVGSFTRIDNNNQSSINFAIPANSLVEVDFENTGTGSISVKSGAASAGSWSAITAGVRRKVVVALTANTVISFTANADGQTGNVAIHSVKIIPQRGSFRTTASQAPFFQTYGGQYDGVDDYHLSTGYVAQAGANCIVLRLNLTGHATADVRVAAGARSTAGDRFFLGFDQSGNLSAGVGSATTSPAVPRDFRGRDAVVGVSFDGGTVRIFGDDLLLYEGAQSGVPTTTYAVAVGALHSQGSFLSHEALTLRDAIFGRKMLSASEFIAISNQLKAA